MTVSSTVEIRNMRKTPPGVIAALLISAVLLSGMLLTACGCVNSRHQQMQYYGQQTIIENAGYQETEWTSLGPPPQFHSLPRAEPALAPAPAPIIQLQSVAR